MYLNSPLRYFLLVTAGLVLSLLFSGKVSAQSVFVNELHYDDAGTDTLEAVEIAAPAGTDLACYKIVFYNGSTTTEYATFFLSGIVPDQCNGYGTLNFLIPGIQNGSPDGFALVYDPANPGCTAGGTLTVIQFLSYEGSFTASNGDAAGLTSTDIGVFEPNTTPEGQSLQLTGSGTTYGDFTWSASPSAHTYGAPNTGQTFGGPVCITGIVADRLTFSVNRAGCTNPGTLFDLVVCATDSNGNVDTSYSGNITISLNSGPGTLSGVTTLPTLLGCAQFTNLSLSAVGTYEFGATDGATFTGTSALTYVTADCDSCPSMTSALIDACGTGEGMNEILFLNSADFSIPVNGTDLQIDYGATNPPATSYTNPIGSNQAYVDSLNTWANCPGLFVDAASNSPIPPHTQIMVMSMAPTYAYNYTAWCGSGPIYVVFSFDPSWGALGNFKNCLDCATNGMNPRYFRLNLSSLAGGGACDYTYEYTPCSDLICAGNGDGLNFPWGGGTPSANWNACNPVVALDMNQEMGLMGKWQDRTPALTWTSLRDPSAVRTLEIERKSAVDSEFEVVDRFSETESAPSEWQDLGYPLGAKSLFYRLRLTGMDGEIALSNEVEVLIPREEFDQIRFSLQSGTSLFEMPREGNFKLDWLDISGRILGSHYFQGEQFLRSELPQVSPGIYLYRVTGAGSSWVGKVYLEK